jgi:hypothetical protein
MFRGSYRVRQAGMRLSYRRASLQRKTIVITVPLRGEHVSTEDPSLRSGMTTRAPTRGGGGRIETSLVISTAAGDLGREAQPEPRPEGHRG